MLYYSRCKYFWWFIIVSIKYGKIHFHYLFLYSKNEVPSYGGSKVIELTDRQTQTHRHTHTHTDRHTDLTEIIAHLHTQMVTMTVMGNRQTRIAWSYFDIVPNESKTFLICNFGPTYLGNTEQKNSGDFTFLATVATLTLEPPNIQQGEILQECSPNRRDESAEILMSFYVPYWTNTFNVFRSKIVWGPHPWTKPITNVFIFYFRCMLVDQRKVLIWKIIS